MKKTSKKNTAATTTAVETITKDFFGMQCRVIQLANGKREDGTEWYALKVFLRHSGGLEELFLSLNEAWADELDGSTLAEPGAVVRIDYTAQRRQDGTIARYIRGIFPWAPATMSGKYAARDQSIDGDRPDADTRPAPETI